MFLCRIPGLMETRDQAHQGKKLGCQCERKTVMLFLFQLHVRCLHCTLHQREWFCYKRPSDCTETVYYRTELSVAADGKVQSGLKLETLGQLFQVPKLCVGKVYQKSIMVSSA